VNPLKTFQQLDSTPRRNFLLLFGSALLFWIGLTTLLPTLPTYAQDLGGNRQQVGFVMGAFALGLLGSRVWLGKLVDSRGRKMALILGNFVGTFAPLSYLLAHSIPSLMLIRAFHGVSLAAFTTGFNTLVVDLAPPKHRGELIGYMGLTVPVGMALGPAIGGYLAETQGYVALFITAGLAGFCALGLTLPIQEKFQKFVPASPSSPSAPWEPPSRSLWQLLTSRALLIPSLILLFIGLVFGNLATFLPLFIREIQLPLNTGLFYTAAAIMGFIARFWTGQASDTYGRGIFISGSLICYLLSMLILTGADTPALFLLAAGLEGLGSGILIPMAIALLSDRSQIHERGQVFAVCISGFDVGIAIAGPIFGWLGESVGYRGLFGITSGLVGLALGIFACRGNTTLENSWAFAWGKAPDHFAIHPAEAPQPLKVGHSKNLN